mmetsp:Transcript_36537/g.82348  ORF Transcript_36537/g.82348 Transcript_36537/m.82348 type:complete len:343 (-) Transcript_36537:61-1089(-)
MLLRAASLLGALLLIGLVVHMRQGPGRQVLLYDRARGKASLLARRMGHVKCLYKKGFGTSLAGCPPPKIAAGEASGFADPMFAEDAGQIQQNNAGWTVSGVLDNSEYAAGDLQRYPPSSVAGHVREISGSPRPAGGYTERGGLSSHCGCAVCPCRGDDDIDVASNGEWVWPVSSRKIAERKIKSARKSKSAGRCPNCVYTAQVTPIREEYSATVIPVQPHKKAHPVHETKTKEKVITKYVPVYKEKTVYVPVYDDPFWNPSDDGRLAGEGVGVPDASPFGALSYHKGAWYEMGNARPNMLDALGGTLDTDRDVDQPADLGVWWDDSLPSGRFESSLSDSDSF